MFDFNVIFATFGIGMINTVNVLMFLMESKVNRKQKTNERESQGINSWVIASGRGGEGSCADYKLGTKYRILHLQATKDKVQNTKFNIWREQKMGTKYKFKICRE